MKTPHHQANGHYAEARAVYQNEPCARTFSEDLEAHMQNGFVFVRPDLFLMGRPVVSSANHADIVNPWHRFSSADCDCWHCYLFSGNISRAFQFIPWPLPLISFERGNVLRFWDAQRIEQLSKAINK